MQRLLWDIGGCLLFGTATVKQVRNGHSYIEDMDDEEQLYHQSGSFVRFLASWSSSHLTLVERIRQLAHDVAEAGFWQSKEATIMEAWLADLQSVGYEFPSIVQSPSPTSITKKRVAVCVTGLTECIQEAWAPTYNNLRSRLEGDMDTFLFLSSSYKKGPVPLDTRLKQARSYMNSTVTILYEDRAIDPNIPPDCNPQFQLPGHVTFPVPGYFQQLWSLSECYDLVRDYEKQFNIRYQLFIRARVDTLAKMPSTFEREGALNINTTIIMPPNRYFPSVDDGFALGPIELMSHYMRRWHSFRECPPDRDFHPETYLKSYLRRFTNITIDRTISGAADAISHGAGLCH